MTKEFDVKLANGAIADYGNIHNSISDAEAFADYADELYEFTPGARDIFEIASDMNGYTLHKLTYWSCSGGISGGVG